MNSTGSHTFSLLALFLFWSSNGQVLSAPMDGKPLSASRVTLNSSGEQPISQIVAAITKQTGMEIDFSNFDGETKVGVNWNNLEFWNALEDLAKSVNGRWEMTPKSKAPKLVKALNLQAPKIFVDGPFRISARDIAARSDLVSGRTTYDLTLEVAWEPRIPVFRIDEVPHPLQGLDDTTRPLTSRTIKARNPVEGFVARSTIRLEGLTRQSKRIESLTGTFFVTASEEMLQFTIADTNNWKSPAPKQGVTLDFKKFSKDGNYWIADVDLRYPPGGPTFESFETYWLSRNRMVLISPNGANKFAPFDHEESGPAIRYRFREDASKGLVLGNRKGWKIEYETPGPMREVPVKFELKGIPLP